MNVSAAPSSSHTVRNGRSVTASIGASRAPGLSWMSPMRMGGRENSIALVGRPAVRRVGAGACRKRAAARSRRRRPQAQPARRPRRCSPTSSIPGRWPRAAGRHAPTSAPIEDIGPYEHARPGDPASPLVQHERPLLDGAGRDRLGPRRRHRLRSRARRPRRRRPARHAASRGTSTPRAACSRTRTLFGLTPTPDDPRGRVGHISASTGVLGLREALRPDGTPSGEIGMTCWLCHGGATDDGVVSWACRARVRLRPPARDRRRARRRATPTAAAYRRARGFPPGRTVRARLLLAGPGAAGSDRRVRPRRDRARLPLGALRGDGARPPGDARHRQPDQRSRRSWRRRGWRWRTGPARRTRRRPGWNGWSRSPDARSRTCSRRSACPTAIVAPPGARCCSTCATSARSGLQHDSFPGLLWSDAIYGHATLSAAATAAIPAMYAAASVREELANETARWRPRGDADEGGDRGRRRARARDLRRADRRARSPTARSSSARRAPTPPRRSTGRCWRRSIRRKPLDAKLPVRCADCHSAAPLENVRPLAENPPPLGRCTHCHVAHVRRCDEWGPSPNPLPAERGEGSLIAIAALASQFGAGPAAEVAFCAGCHAKHRDFGPLVYSSSRLFPFDADGDGDAQGDPGRRPARGRHRHRAAAGVRRPDHAAAVRDRRRRHRRSGARRPRRPRPHRRRWVRAAPLVALRASAPYLHNGSVPTLRALLEPAARRPVTLPARRRRLRARHARPRQRQPGPRVRHRAQRRREAGPDRASSKRS